MTAGQKLRQLRKQRDLVQKQAGGVINVSQQQYGRYETDKDPLPDYHAITFAAFYKVKPEEIKPDIIVDEKPLVLTGAEKELIIAFRAAKENPMKSHQFVMAVLKLAMERLGEGR